jgi:AcrR family transcriptional regulator
MAIAPEPDAAAKPARDRILDAAAELFYAQGINSVGVDAIVAKSGVAKMTLYKHFGNKDQLIAAWLRRASEGWRAHFEASVNRIAPNPKDRLLAFFDCLAEWFADPSFRGCAFINCLSELPDPAHPARQVAAEHRKAVREHLTRLASEAGFKNPSGLAQSLGMVTDGAIVAALADASPEHGREAGRLAKGIIANAK